MADLKLSFDEQYPDIPGTRITLELPISSFDQERTIAAFKQIAKACKWAGWNPRLEIENMRYVERQEIQL